MEQNRRKRCGAEVPVPRPEHLAALKVVALKNDPDRAFRDQEDLRFLVQPTW
jgi:hypothetical protein